MAPERRLSKLVVTLTVLTCASLRSVQADSNPPTNVRSDCPNLNCTVYWDPPEGTTENDTLYYTTEHQDCNQIPTGLVTQCSNSTERECYLGNDLTDPSKYWCVFVVTHNEDGTIDDPLQFGGALDFHAENTDFDAIISDWRTKVSSLKEGDPEYSTPKTVDVVPYYAATLGEAYIVNVTTTSRSIYLEWNSPYTPYYDSSGSQLRMEDYYSILYNLTYWDVSDPAEHMEQEKNSAEFIYLSGEKIIPWSTYTIVVQGRLHVTARYGEQVDVTVTTDEEAPGKGVTLTEDGQSHDCDISPDVRDVYISWQAIEWEYWYGDLTKYQVRYRCQENATTIETNVNTTSVILSDISRWCAYDVDVSVCNSAGCTGSENPLTIDSIKIARDPPVNVTAYDTSYTSFNVTWLPPDNDECVHSYNVRYTSNIHEGETVSYGLHAHIRDVPSDTEYTVTVSANIYDYYDSTDESEPRSTTVRLVDWTTQVGLIVIMVVLGLIVVGLIILYACYKKKEFVYKNCFGAVKKDSFDSYMVGVLDDRPSVPTHEAFEYDRLYAPQNGITLGVNLDTSSPTETGIASQVSPQSSDTGINGSPGMVLNLSLSDILLPCNSDDSSGVGGNDQPMEEYLRVAASDSQEPSKDGSHGVVSYVRVGAGNSSSASSEGSQSGYLQKSVTPEGQRIVQSVEDGETQGVHLVVETAGDWVNDSTLQSDEEDIGAKLAKIGIVLDVDNDGNGNPNLEEKADVNSCGIQVDFSDGLEDAGERSTHTGGHIADDFGQGRDIESPAKLDVQFLLDGSYCGDMEYDNQLFESHELPELSSGSSSGSKSASSCGTNMSGYTPSLEPEVAQIDEHELTTTELPEDDQQDEPDANLADILGIPFGGEDFGGSQSEVDFSDGEGQDDDDTQADAAKSSNYVAPPCIAEESRPVNRQDCSSGDQAHGDYEASVPLPASGDYSLAPATSDRQDRPPTNYVSSGYVPPLNSRDLKSEKQGNFLRQESSTSDYATDDDICRSRHDTAASKSDESPAEECASDASSDSAVGSSSDSNLDIENHPDGFTEAENSNYYKSNLNNNNIDLANTTRTPTSDFCETFCSNDQTNVP